MKWATAMTWLKSKQNALMFEGKDRGYCEFLDHGNLTTHIVPFTVIMIQGSNLPMATLLCIRKRNSTEFFLSDCTSYDTNALYQQ